MFQFNYKQQRKEYEQKQEQKAEERKQQFELEQKEHEAERARREKLHKARVSKRPADHFYERIETVLAKW